MARNKIVTKTRRSNGEGSIYQRKDGRWVGYMHIGYTDKGQPKRKMVYGKTQLEVAKKLSDISGGLKSLTFDVVEKKTFGELMKDWLLVFKKASVTARSFEGNMRNFNLHIKPIIGNMKIYDVDTMVAQKVINNMMNKGYANETVKKIKHLMNQFFEYAIDNKWVNSNPMYKVRVKLHDRKVYDGVERYKALSPEGRTALLDALIKDEANFIKPLCVTLMFAGLRIGEALALKWKNVNFENKTLKIERSITTDPIFDEEGRVKGRVTVVGDTKTACSVREIPIVDVVVETLLQWKEKQAQRQRNSTLVTAELTNPESFIFSNDDGTVRSYSGTRVIFDRFKKRNNLDKYHIHFHGLRHTFSNMLFEMNENPKVIQQLLGHRDVKTTITVYNSVDSEYIRQTTDKFNEKIKEDKLLMDEKRRQEDIEERQNSLIRDMSDEEYEDFLLQLIEERKARKQKDKDFEM